ncbi:MAG: outer membrane protein assembly factor [Deltaproteobacteria bacterium]|nr:outer membrane protein assembly factor [Deltaproteobacteria bacterium]
MLSWAIALCAAVSLVPVCVAWGKDTVKVELRGLEGKAKENAEAVLSLPPGLVRDGKVDRYWLNRLVDQAPDKVREALEPFGYYDAAAAVRIEAPEEGTYRIVVTVDPGEPVRVTSVDVRLTGAGADETALRRLADDFPLKKGDALRQDVYEQMKGALQSRAQDLGYLDADFAVHTIRLNRAARSAAIDLELATGPEYLFDGVTLEGASEYPDHFLRRYLAFKAGEPFSYAKLGQTQLNFGNSDRFEEVIITPRKEAAKDRNIPVDIRLTPSAPKRLRPGVGYGTDTGPRISLKYQDVNFLHKGHELQGEFYLSQRSQAAAGKYILPDRSTASRYTSLELGLMRENVDTYLTRSVFAELDRVRDFGGGRKGSLYLRLLYERYAVGSEDSTSFVVLPGVRYSQRHFIGSELRPVQGYRFALEARGTTRALGSDTGFGQLLASGNLLASLPFRLSLLSRIDVGYTDESGPWEKIPASLRFFAGGDHSVRGYAYQSLGPKDNTGMVVGGRHRLVGSVEVERALRENWGVAAFFDAGNAFDSYSHLQLYKGAGIGVRYYTLIGPIRVDLARQLRVEDPAYRVHLSVGLAF